MPTNLLPIDQIIKRARAQGAYLGHGDPKIHLAYLTKLKLLPQTIRRKISNKIQGCYPDFVLPLLSQIEELRSKGLTYPQIRYQLNENRAVIPPQITSSSTSQNLIFLTVGLILGFLLAASRNNPGYQPTGIVTDKANLLYSQNLNSTDPIYLIAIPDQNLYKLGKISVNELR